jgi:endonuclease YncB( thermonuclease family)
MLSNLRGPVEVDGRLLRPIDGDTFSYNGIKVRVRGIDAPEIGTPGGFEAAQRFAALLREGSIKIVPVSQDVYGRTVADVFLNGQNLADMLIAEGYARRE